MVSKQQVKFIKSLQYKKYRRKANAFLVEGEKSVLELLASGFRTVSMTGTKAFFERNKEVLEGHDADAFTADAGTLAGMGTYRTNNSVIAVAELPGNRSFTVDPADHILALQSVRDPGNLGTIIRSADWYGFNKIIASPDTVDLYNPKVISATKGSFTRVRVYYGDIAAFVHRQRDLVVYGACMRGAPLYDVRIQTPSLIVLGNEAQGIDRSLDKMIDFPVTIPRVGGAESLNVAIAAAVFCDHIRREIPGSGQL